MPQQRYIIVAHALQTVEWSCLDQSPDAIIVAVDGAANQFRAHGRNPNIILGDFDSIQDPAYWGITSTFDTMQDSDAPYIGHHNVLIVPAKNQNLTDLDKAIHWCDAQGASSINILNATGGRADHALGNLGLLRKHFKAERELFIQTSDQTIFYTQGPQTTHLHSKTGQNCSIMGFPKGEIIMTNGLAYEIEQGRPYLLDMGLSESLCNRLKEPHAKVETSGEVLFIIPAQQLTSHHRDTFEPSEKHSS